MPQHTIDCPAQETLDTPPAGGPVRMRYELIVRIRREIQAGLYDNPARVDRMLDACVGRIVEGAYSD